MDKEEFKNYLRSILFIMIVTFCAILIAFSVWVGIWFIDRQMTIYDTKIQYNKMLEELNRKK